MLDSPVTESPRSDPTRDASILVVAEHAIVRVGLRTVLDAAPGLCVVAEAVGVEEATAIAPSVRPDVILLDPPRAEVVSALALGALRRAAPDACLVCLGRGAPFDAAELRCVPPESDVGQFCAELGAMLGERCAVCLLRPQCVAPRIAIALSPRERQVAARVARGMSSKQIAAALGIKLRTVNTYRESLARKLGASSPAVVTRYVLEHGLHTAQ